MKRITVAVLAGISLFAAQAANGEMREHMKDHMGGGMTGTQAESKQAGKETEKGLAQEAEAAGVTVKVAYKNPSELKNPVFDVALDTHSVDLDQYKFDRLILLRDDTGKEYHPDIVSSSGSGHHREATLEFKDADISGAKYVEVVVEGVAGVEERVFKFELQKDMMK